MLRMLLAVVESASPGRIVGVVLAVVECHERSEVVPSMLSSLVPCCWCSCRAPCCMPCCQGPSKHQPPCPLGDPSITAFGMCWLTKQGLHTQHNRAMPAELYRTNCFGGVGARAGRLCWAQLGAVGGHDWARVGRG